MKKIISILLIITILISCTACGKKKNIDENKTITFNNLSLKVPNEFKDKEENKARETFKSYELLKDNNTCSLYLTYHEVYVEEDKAKDKINEWLEISKELDNSNAEIEFKDINKTNWGYIRLEGYSTIEYQYSTINDNKLYTIQYKYDKESEKSCDQYVKNIMNSLNFSK